MVRVAASMHIKAEGVEEFLTLAKEMVEKTNKLDAGCVRYELCRDLGDPLHFMMQEEWTSQEALDKHIKSAHFVELIPKMDATNSKPAEMTLLEKVY